VRVLPVEQEEQEKQEEQEEQEEHKEQEVLARTGLHVGKTADVC